MRLNIVIRLLGLLIISIALNMVGALAWAIYFAETAWRDILLAMALSIAIGGASMGFSRRATLTTLTRKEAMLIVGVGWIAAGLIGALPFYIGGHIPHYYDAFFETVSGFTTTGASILTNIEALPRSLLFWRSYTHWMGGMGIIVLFVALFPFLGVGGKKLFQFEVPGPDVENLHPKTQTTAFLLWGIYVGISALETIALKLAGMPLFDALCHTFGSMATGGFSTKNTSIGFYPSSAIHIIITVFMMVAGANFTLYYFLLKKRFAQVVRDTELKAYVLIIGVSTAIFTVVLYAEHAYASFGETAVDAWFNVVSIMTTTGYGTANTDQWPMILKVWLLLLMFVGGCGGSTGGGIKVVRFVVLWRYTYAQIINSYSPQRKCAVRLSGKPINQLLIDRIAGFFFLYLLVYALGVLMIAAYGYDWPTTISSVAACLNNIGPGFGLVGVMGNYAFMHAFPKVILSILMIAGRLELFTILIWFAPDFWKR